jgi:hypothetical protein
MLYTDSLNILIAGVALVVINYNDVSAHLHVRKGSRRARGFLRSNFKQFFKIVFQDWISTNLDTFPMHKPLAGFNHSANIAACDIGMTPPSQQAVIIVVLVVSFRLLNALPKYGVREGLGYFPFLSHLSTFSIYLLYMHADV